MDRLIFLLIDIDIVKTIFQIFQVHLSFYLN